MAEHEPLTPLPFPLPERFLERLGYRHDRTLVGVHWEPLGDEVVYNDGVDSLVGADQYTYWELTRQPQVRAWLLERAINLGNSDEPASHWLIIDRQTNQGFIAPAKEARKRIQQQRLINIE